ncbi:MAG: hypothetical protein DWQ01_17620 [Planctomycetota bacterium]|nr:MAG: hypothetical protein DWQ01_17620 [Planctomycetota bacterium]
MTYTDPEGSRRFFGFDSYGRIVQRIDAYDPNQSNQPATVWEYDSSGCCGQVTKITYPDSREQHFQFTADGDLEYIWWKADNGDFWRVERFGWTPFDPEAGQYFLRMAEHDLIRDSVEGEDPDNHCDDSGSSCQVEIPGLVRQLLTWDSKGRLTSIDFDDYQYDADPQIKSFRRSQTFAYYGAGPNEPGYGTDQMLLREDRVNGQVVSQVNYLLDDDHRFIKEMEVTDPVNGGSWTWQWTRDKQGRILTEQGPDGIVHRFQWDQKGNQYLAEEDWDGGSSQASRTTQYFFDLSGNLAKEQLVSGAETEVTEYSYDDREMISQVSVTGTDGVTRATTYGFDLADNLLWSQDWRGFKTILTYTTEGLRLPKTISREYQGNSQILWQAGSSSNDSGYDLLGRLVSWRNAEGWISVQDYDRHGRLKNVFEQTDGNHFSRTHFLYDARGFVKETEFGAIQGSPQSPTASVWHLHKITTRNTAGHLLAERIVEEGASEPSRATTYEIDWRGLPTKISVYHGDRSAGAANADISVTRMTWDARGRLLGKKQMLDDTAGTWLTDATVQYHDSQRKIEFFGFEDGGRQSRVESQFDDLGRPTAVTEWEWTGSSWGQSRTYDKSFDGLDRVLSMVDPLGHRVETEYDGLGRPELVRKVPVGGGAPQVTDYVWNSTDGTLSKVIDAEGKETLFDYTGDPFLRQKKVTHPDGRFEEILIYDSLDRPVEFQDSAGVKHTLTYDFDYLVSDLADASGIPEISGPNELAWEFDRMSGLLQTSRVLDQGIEVWTTQFQFNHLGELLSEVQGLSGSQHAWAWSYGYSGEIHQVQYPSGLGISQGDWSYDSSGRPTSVAYQDGSTPLSTYAFEYEGLRLKRRLESHSSTRLVTDFDGFGRLTSLIADKDDGNGVFEILEGQLQAFDLGDRVIARKRALDGTGEVFEHDAFGRLKDWFEGVPNPLTHTPGQDPNTYTEVTRYSLNSVYGRQSVERQPYGGQAETESYVSNDAHFYLTVTDPGGTKNRNTWNGLLRSDDQYRYFYDAWNRLTRVETLSGGEVREHLYDAEGRRVRTVEDGLNPIRFVYWGMGLAALYPENGPSSEIQTYGLTGHEDSEAFVRTGVGPSLNVFQIARDLQGSFLALIDSASQSVVERYRYDAFGQVSIEDGNGQSLSASAFGNRRFFLGRIFDQTLGLYDLRARWYDPVLGTFLAPDPSGPVDSWNLYQYGFGTPATWWDPTGLSSIGRLWDRIKRPLAGFASEIISLGLSFTPVGDVLDAVSALMGKDIITGQSLDLSDRGLAVAAALAPFVSYGTLRGVKEAIGSGLFKKIVRTLKKALGKLWADFKEFLKEMFEKLKDKAKKCTKGGGDLRNAAQKVGGSNFDLGKASAARNGRGFGAKAPQQVTPGVQHLQGQYIDDVGQVQPWRAQYDEFGRLKERTDFTDLPDPSTHTNPHHHTREYGPGYGRKGKDTRHAGPGPYTGIWE